MDIIFKYPLKGMLEIENRYILDAINRFSGIEENHIAVIEFEKMNWENVFSQAIKHRILPIVYCDMLKNNYLKYINNNWYKALLTIYNNSINLNKLLLCQAIDLSKQILKKNISACIIKGPVLSVYLYEGEGVRPYSDLDILVMKNFLNDMKSIIKEQKYVQGKYDKKENKIIEATRSEIIQREMFTHESVEFHKILYLPFPYDSVIDLNHGVSWKGNKFNQVPEGLTAEILLHDRKEYNYDKNNIIGLCPENMFIHLCLHLYSESVLFCWQYSWYKNFSDIELIKYIDIALILQKNLDWSRINEMVEEYKIQIPINYAVSLTCMIFPQLKQNINLETYLKPLNELDFYFDREGLMHKWNYSFLERIFNQNLRLKDVREHTNPETMFENFRGYNG